LVRGDPFAELSTMCRGLFVLDQIGE
jgi:hypothetical protein